MAAQTSRAVGRAAAVTAIAPLPELPELPGQPRRPAAAPWVTVWVTGARGTRFHDGPPVEPVDIRILERTLACLLAGTDDPASQNKPSSERGAAQMTNFDDYDDLFGAELD